MHLRAKILIAEDEGIIAIGIKKILQRHGYIVVGHVRTGEEVISIVSEIKPDLILMDIMLAGKINGLQTAEEIFKKYTIPVIFITALNDDETFLEAYKSRPEDYIVKPFNEKKLIASVEKALNNKVPDEKK